MVKEQLTRAMINFGKDLLKKIDKENLQIQSAFWFLIEETGEWRLILASPLVRMEGPIFMYGKIGKLLKNTGSDDTNFSLSDISVIEDDNKLVKIISQMIGCVPEISEVRLSKNSVNGHYIEDALIFRLNFIPK